jgi:hypothetical protein
MMQKTDTGIDLSLGTFITINRNTVSWYSDNGITKYTGGISSDPQNTTIICSNSAFKNDSHLKIQFTITGQKYLNGVFASVASNGDMWYCESFGMGWKKNGVFVFDYIVKSGCKLAIVSTLSHAFETGTTINLLLGGEN